MGRARALEPHPRTLLRPPPGDDRRTGCGYPKSRTIIGTGSGLVNRANRACRGARTGYSAKEKTASEAPQTFGSFDPMRLAQGWAGIRRRRRWSDNCTHIHSRQGPRPLFPNRKCHRTIRYLRSPGEIDRSCCTKNPSAATNKGRIASETCCKHRLPQARCLLRLTLLPPACCSRGQV
jgi:hypothetical protein